MSRQLTILGCRLDLVDASEAVETIIALARRGNGAQIITLGTEMVVAARRDPSFLAVVNASSLNVCDTVGLLAVARLRGASLRERVTGVELIDALAARSVVEKLGIYLLGGAPDVAAAAAAALQARYPGLRIAGTADGYFRLEEEARVLNDIRESGARIVLVGLGSPRQEFWLAQHSAELPGVVGIGIGGSFDVLSGRVARAPRAWRTLHLEWLYRLVTEPSRWRRQLALPTFVWLVIKEQLFSRPSAKGY